METQTLDEHILQITAKDQQRSLLRPADVRQVETVANHYLDNQVEVYLGPYVVGSEMRTYPYIDMVVVGSKNILDEFLAFELLPKIWYNFAVFDNDKIKFNVIQGPHDSSEVVYHTVRFSSDSPATSIIVLTMIEQGENFEKYSEKVGDTYRPHYTNNIRLATTLRTLDEMRKNTPY